MEISLLRRQADDDRVTEWYNNASKKIEEYSNKVEERFKEVWSKVKRTDESAQSQLEELKQTFYRVQPRAVSDIEKTQVKWNALLPIFPDQINANIAIANKELDQSINYWDKNFNELLKDQLETVQSLT